MLRGHQIKTFLSFDLIQKPWNCDIFWLTHFLSNFISAFWPAELHWTFSNASVISLMNRRSRVDLIFTYRIMHSLHRCVLGNLFQLSSSNLRSHAFKVYHGNFRTTPREHQLSNRILHLWNSLPNNVVGATSVNFSKNSLDIVLSSS